MYFNIEYNLENLIASNQLLSEMIKPLINDKDLVIIFDNKSCLAINYFNNIPYTYCPDIICQYRDDIIKISTSNNSSTHTQEKNN